MIDDIISQGLGCGWCYDKANPIKGHCLPGSFKGQLIQNVTIDKTENKSCDNEDQEWSYAECPDIDECNLNMHDCHPDATCQNVHGSYECQCQKGFIGDGKIKCERTCYEDCIHGKCSDGPDYKCICDLGKSIANLTVIIFQNHKKLGFAKTFLLA